MTTATAHVDVPTLQSGDHLTRDEFIRIWKQLPHIKRAELIGGIVYLASPTSADHGDMDFNFASILGYYRMITPGCRGGSNTTTYMLHDSSVQPDINLRVIPEYGGKSWVEDTFLNGSPELLTEISYSSASIDLHEKLELYEKAKIEEYLVVLVRKQEIRWHRLSRGKYRLIEPDAKGVYRSLIFPGLWLDSKALFADDMTKVLATLQEGIASDEHQQFVAELAKRKKAIKYSSGQSAEEWNMATGTVNEPWLATGDNLSRDEFLHIWEQLPDVKFAELIGGIVYMSSPVRREHGKTDKCITAWLAHYEAYTPGCEAGLNTTSLIGEDCPQPDDYLLILPEYGGRSWGTKYVEGSPEFLAEISFTTASMDLHQKHDLYEREGIQEYLVVLIKREQIRWHRLDDGKYRLIEPDTNGIYRSLVFPGLWLDSTALFENNMAKILATLQEGIASDEHQQFVTELARRKGEAK